MAHSTVSNFSITTMHRSSVSNYSCIIVIMTCFLLNRAIGLHSVIRLRHPSNLSYGCGFRHLSRSLIARKLSSHDDSNDCQNQIRNESIKQRDSSTLGSAKVPFTWDELKTLVHDNQLDKMSRSRSEQDRYEEYTAKIKSEWLSVVDHILCSKFDFDRVLVDAFTDELNQSKPRQLLKAVPSLDEVSFVRTSLCRNDFPYYVEDNVQHWCLWKLYENVNVDDIATAKRALYEELDAEEFIHFVNPPHLKSIPQIDHAHIFIRLSECL